MIVKYEIIYLFIHLVFTKYEGASLCSSEMGTEVPITPSNVAFRG